MQFQASRLDSNTRVHTCYPEAGISTALGQILVKVQEVLKMIEQAGWRLARARGSHRQYHHPERPGTVTVHGKLSDEVHPKTLASIRRQAGL
jgi:predicted RNA binding protein YcfA (HicA-like mRNA interferase family)